MTGSLPAPRPLWLEVEPDPVFGTFHAPAEESGSGTAVLILPPWGWDEITSYRARRAWAERLAAEGHPTLRIDLPGTGDSGGRPSDAGLVEDWINSVVASASWLAATSGRSRIATIGLGLGGLIAGAAIARGAPIDDLVLWAAPIRGRAFLREQRAFAALQSSRFSMTGESEPTLLPDGWLEVGGFVLSAETITAIAELDLASMSLATLKRALLLERDGMGRDRDFEARLTAQGVDVTDGPGDGWTDMVLHPERYSEPSGVFDRASSWLEQAFEEEPLTTAPPPPEAKESSERVVHDHLVRESSLRIDQPYGQLFGLITEPVDAPRSGHCAVFLNAGAIRRVGPNRMWVETSRRWAGRGLPTVRVDLEGIGDTDGDPRRFYDVGNFYTDGYGAQVPAILDALVARGFGPRFTLIGLCAGAYWAFNTAAVDSRVTTAIAINPRAIVWDPDLRTRREARKVERLLEPALWNRIVRGQVRPSRVLEISRAVASRTAAAAIDAPRRLRSGRNDQAHVDSTISRLDAVQALGTRVVMAFSGDEPVHDELSAEGILSGSARWPNVVIETLPGRDHTVRPIVAQRAVNELLDRELDRLLS